jgi:hypothetical protein
MKACRVAVKGVHVKPSAFVGRDVERMRERRSLGLVAPYEIDGAAHVGERTPNFAVTGGHFATRTMPRRRAR